MPQYLEPDLAGLAGSPDKWVAHTLTIDDLDPKWGKDSISRIANKFGVPAKIIVSEGNGIEWDKDKINQWIIESEGKMLKSGSAVFVPGNSLYLPAGSIAVGAKKEAASPKLTQNGTGSGGNMLMWGGAVLGGLWLIRQLTKDDLKE